MLLEGLAGSEQPLASVRSPRPVESAARLARVQRLPESVDIPGLVGRNRAGLSCSSRTKNTMERGLQGTLRNSWHKQCGDVRGQLRGAESPLVMQRASAVEREGSDTEGHGGPEAVTGEVLLGDS